MCIYIILYYYHHHYDYHYYIYIVATDRRHCCDKYAEAAKEKNGTKAQHASASDAGPRPSTSVKAVKSCVQCTASLDPWMVTLVPWSKLD